MARVFEVAGRLKSLTVAQLNTLASGLSPGDAGQLYRCSDWPTGPGLVEWTGSAWRKILSNIVLVANVLDFYGGSGDHDTAIAAAEAAGYLGVYFPAGIYTCQQIPLSSYKTYFGDGISSTIIRLKAGNYSANAKTCVMINQNYGLTRTDNTPTDYNITVRDLTLDGNKANITGTATEMEGLNFVGVKDGFLERVEILNTIHDGIDLDYCTDVTIQDCVIKNCNWNGIHSGNISVNQFNTRTKIFNARVEGCASTRASFDDFYAGIHNDSLQGIVFGCTVINCTGRGILNSAGSQPDVKIEINTVTGTLATGVGGKKAYDIQFGCTRGICKDNTCSSTATDMNIYITGSFDAPEFVGNKIDHPTQGILCDASKSVKILGNTLRGSMISYAIQAYGAAHRIVDNDIQNCPSNAARGAISITASSGAGSLIRENLIANQTPGMAILSQAANVEIEDNKLSTTGTPAKYIEVQAAGNIVRRNRGSGATIGVNLTAASSNGKISANDFSGCATPISYSGSGHSDPSRTMGYTAPETPNGSITAFTLPKPLLKEQVQAVYDGLVINPSSYSISGAVLTFTSAPPSGIPLWFNFFE